MLTVEDEQALQAYELQAAADLVEMAVLEGCDPTEAVEEAIRGYPHEDFMYLGWWVFWGGRVCNRILHNEPWP